MGGWWVLCWGWWQGLWGFYEADDENDAGLVIAEIRKGAYNQDPILLPDINGAGIEATNVASIICEAWVLVEAVSVVEAHVVGAVGGEGGVLRGSH